MSAPKVTAEQLSQETASAAEGSIAATEDKAIPESPMSQRREDPSQSSNPTLAQQQQSAIETLAHDQRQLLERQNTLEKKILQVDEQKREMDQRKQQETENPPKAKPDIDGMTEMMKAMMSSQSDVTMKMFKDMMKEQGFRTGEKTWSSEYKPPRLHENRIEAKSFSRMSQFVGGETDYKEWMFDIETTVESVCPGFNAMLKQYMASPGAGKEPEYGDFPLEHAETRSKEFYNLLCILTAGEAKSIIRNSGDGLRAWHKLWHTYNRRTLARSLRKYKEAIMPRTATNPGEIISRINEWETKVKELLKV